MSGLTQGSSEPSADPSIDLASQFSALDDAPSKSKRKRGDTPKGKDGQLKIGDHTEDQEVLLPISCCCWLHAGDQRDLWQQWSPSSSTVEENQTKENGNNKETNLLSVQTIGGECLEPDTATSKIGFDRGGISKSVWF